MARPWAKKFYKSKAWKLCRESYIASVHGLCETCLKKNKVKPGYIVHHTIKLTPENINDPAIALNHKLLRYDCLDCHNEDELNEHGFKSSARCTFDIEGNVIPIDIVK